MNSLIWAQSRNGVIGNKGGIPWKLHDDMRNFITTTKGHPVIMGRGTFESMKKVLLKERQNIVVTSQKDYQVPGGCLVAHSLTEALSLADPDPFFIGGSKIYKEALKIADKLYITRVDAEVEGDTFFPDFDITLWNLLSSETHNKDDKNEFNFTIEIYERRK